LLALPAEYAEQGPCIISCNRTVSVRPSAAGYLAVDPTGRRYRSIATAAACDAGSATLSAYVVDEHRLVWVNSETVQIRYGRIGYNIFTCAQTRTVSQFNIAHGTNKNRKSNGKLQTKTDRSVHKIGRHLMPLLTVRKTHQFHAF